MKKKYRARARREKGISTGNIRTKEESTTDYKKTNKQKLRLFVCWLVA